jgi:hypothetical protein
VTADWPALCTILPNQMAALVVMAGGVNAGILPSPERKVPTASHQAQISRQFGCTGERSWPVMIEMNKKGGIKE